VTERERPANYGPMHVMIGPGAAPIRPESPTSVRPIARQIGQWRLPGTRRARAVTLAFCWAHVRRRFYEIAAAGLAPIASERHSWPQRRRMAVARQEKSRPIIDEFEPWLRAKLALINQKIKPSRQSAMRCHAGRVHSLP
jgi:hypothetical protein